MEEDAGGDAGLDDGGEATTTLAGGVADWQWAASGEVAGSGAARRCKIGGE